MMKTCHGTQGKLRALTPSAPSAAASDFSDRLGKDLYAHHDRNALPFPCHFHIVIICVIIDTVSMDVR